MTRKDPSHAARLEVRISRVVGTAADDTVATVFCPRRHQTLLLDECARCAHCRGLTIDTTSRSSFLMCDGVRDPKRAPARSGTREGSASRTPVSDAMTRNVVCVRPDLGVGAVTALFLERGISGAPVIGRDGKPVGLVSKTDLLRVGWERGDTGECDEPIRFRTEGGWDVELGSGFHVTRLESSTVADVMTPMTVSVSEDVSIALASALMVLEGIHRVPVVGAGGRVVGILSALDVLRWLARSNGYLLPDTPTPPTPV